MRVFENCLQAMKEIERDLVVRGVWVYTNRMQDIDTTNDPDYETKELIGYSYCVVDSSDKDKMLDEVNLSWAKEEFQERIDNKSHHSNPGKAWVLRSSIWAQFLKKHKGRFAYTYHDRLRNQVKLALNELSIHPQTRQAIISVYDRQVDPRRIGNDRIPCSMHYQFLVRNCKLDVIYSMRSTDFYTHFKNDIWLACELRNWFAKKLSLEPGKFYHMIGSLHYYRKDEPKAGVF